jgi:hypothetical protein
VALKVVVYCPRAEGFLPEGGTILFDEEPLTSCGVRLNFVNIGCRKRSIEMRFMAPLVIVGVLLFSPAGMVSAAHEMVLEGVPVVFTCPKPVPGSSPTG